MTSPSINGGAGIFRRGILWAVVAGGLLSLFVAIGILYRTIDTLSTTEEEPLWAVHQLKLESARLVDAAKLFQSGVTSRDAFLYRLDIFVSRVPLIDVGPAGRRVASIERLKEDWASLRSDLAALDELALEVTSSDDPALQTVIESGQSSIHDMDEFLAASRNDFARYDAERRREMLRLLGLVVGLMVLIGVTMAFLGGMLLTRMRQLAQAKEVAETAHAQKSRFLAVMSHEIRTPLTGIIGTLENAVTCPLSPEPRKLVDIALSSADGLMGIVNNVLDQSKLEADAVHLVEGPFDVRDLTESAVALMRNRAEVHGTRLQAEIEASVPALVMGDRARVRQILLNLISNAVKFTRDGTITVSARLLPGGGPAGTLELAVTDTGTGIPSDQLESIFERFSQVKEGNHAGSAGTGLGLSISRQLSRLMGGDITVQSGVGQGSTFILRLPQATLPAAAITPDPAPVPPSPAVAPTDSTTAAPVEGTDAETGPGAAADEAPDNSQATTPPPSKPALRVLVAEDNGVNQLVIKTLLEREGHCVLQAENGQVAVDLWRAEAPDLVLMDIEMPVMNGLEAARAILAACAEANQDPVPIIAITANAFIEDRERAFEAGMVDFVTKPFRADDLLQAMRSAVQQRQSALPPVPA